MQPLVSVFMVTYNQRDYIEKAISSVMMQEVDFDIELVIGDDKSTDGTKEICEKLQASYPKAIKYVYNDINLGMQKNYVETLSRCKGKYVALLEGDDEWIDKKKLKKQVELMEARPDVTICYSNALINDTQNPEAKMYFTDANRPKAIVDCYSVIQHCVVPTCTVMLRNNIIKLPDWFTQARATAYFLFYLYSREGKMFYIDEPLALYNHHYGGMSRLTSLAQMLYGDSLLNYRLVEFYNQDKRIFEIAVDKNLVAVDNLFHMGSFKKAIGLFWKQPFYKFPMIPSLYKRITKTFFKIHLLHFLSKDEKKGVY